MPNKKSAIKRVRQNEKRRLHNRKQRSSMRTSVKAVLHAVETQNLEGVDQLINKAQSKLGKAAKVNLVKKKTASRRVSRLMKAVNRAKAASAQAEA